jgi:SRSO17 transposase
MEGGRKSIEPLAERIKGADVQSLRQFVGQSPWAVEQIQQKLAQKVVDLLAEPEVWMIDETSFPKAGAASVGVARQYCGALGKIANCQVAVSLHWSTCEASCPLAWRLYLPPKLVGNSSPAGGGQDSRGHRLSEQKPTGAGIGGSSIDVGRAPAASGRRFSLRQRL